MKIAVVGLTFVLGLLWIAAGYLTEIHKTEALVRIQMIDKAARCSTQSNPM